LIERHNGAIMKGKYSKENTALHQAIHEAVENQIKENNPKETKITFERLMNLGYNRHEVIHKIGAVVVDKIYDAMKQKKPYNENRFTARLKRLK